jgi:NAD(P)H-dependent FMN reductase
LGGIRCLPHLRLLLTNLGVTVSPAQLALGRADQAFDSAGNLGEPNQQKLLEQVVADLIRLATAIRS